ncbi:MAG: hypothetical protein ACYC9Q_13460 [Bacillota bacterium]
MKRLPASVWLSIAAVLVAVGLAFVVAPAEKRLSLAATVAVVLVSLVLFGAGAMAILGGRRAAKGSAPERPERPDRPIIYPDAGEFIPGGHARSIGGPWGTTVGDAYRRGPRPARARPARRAASSGGGRIRRFLSAMTPARRLVLIGAVVLGVIGVVTLLALPVLWPGLVGLLLAAIVTVVDLVGNDRARYVGGLKALADAQGLTVIGQPAEQAGQGLVRELERLYPGDVFALKAGGHYPYVIGRFRGFLVTVRRPFASGLKSGVTEATRVAVHLRSGLKGLTIYDADDAPSGFRYTPSGDAAFDERFKVRALDPAAMPVILGPDVRAGLLRFGRVGLEGFEVGHFGLFFYERGLAADPAVLTEVLGLLASMAEGVGESVGLNGG